MLLLERLIQTVAPHLCISCGKEGSLVCGWCLPDFCVLIPERCYRCSVLKPDSQTCSSCRRHSSLRHVWVASELTGLTQELVHVFKFERAQAAAGVVAGCMKAAMPYMEDFIFVPVPTATNRIRQRGYDHTKLLARSLSSYQQIPALSLLARHGQTRQVGARRSERRIQLQGAFRVIRPDLITRQHIVLVDDVVTTGATLEEAARVLKQAGAKRIDAIVFAQKLT